MKCSRHPRYKGINKPRVECVDCWVMYLQNKGEHPIKDNEKRKKFYNSHKSLSYEDLAPIFGILPKSVRSWVYKNGLEKRSKDRIFESEVDKDGKIEYLESELKDYKRKYKDVTKEKAELDQLVTSLNDVADEREPIPVPALPEKDGKTDEHVIFMVGDIHMGEVVDVEATGGISSYNVRIADARMDYTTNKAISIVRDKLGGGYRFPKAHIFLMGDMVSGSIHEELEITNELTEIEAVFHVVDKLEKLIEMFCQYFPEVQVDCIVGNHGRTKKKKFFKQRVKKDYDFMVYKMLQREMKPQTNLKINVPLSYWTVVNVNGRNFFLTHGSQVRSWMGIPFYGLQREFLKWKSLSESYGKHFDDMVVGHFHSPNVLNIQRSKLIMNGSPKGGDEFSLGAMTAASDPVQFIFGVHEKYGLTWNFSINSCEIK